MQPSKDITDSDQLVSEEELFTAKFAVPLSKEFLEHNEISVNDLPVGQVRQVRQVRLAAKLEEADEPSDSPVIPEPNDLIGEMSIPTGINVDSLFAEESNAGDLSDLNSLLEQDGRKKLDKTRIRSLDSYMEEGSHVEALPDKRTTNLTMTVLEDTNKGISPDSRRYIRGVLHKHIGSFKAGVVGYLLALFLILSGFAALIFVVVDREKFWWAGFGPGLSILGLLIYIMTSSKASCPVCNQRQFRPKNCYKHKEAHKLGFLGHMLPTAIHSLLFKWFRCMFCGTSVRLKK